MYNETFQNRIPKSHRIYSLSLIIKKYVYDPMSIINPIYILAKFLWHHLNSFATGNTVLCGRRFEQEELEDKEK